MFSDFIHNQMNRVRNCVKAQMLSEKGILMYLRLCDNIALRSWNDVEYAYYKKGVEFALPLSMRQVSVLLLCDGEHDVEADETVLLLMGSNIIEACEKGEKPSDWSSYRRYDNLYFPRMNFMITGKCNYNCLHCFNAADNAPLMTEWDFEDICILLDQAASCGVNCFTITGGEPMLHRHFLDILKEIYRRNMFVSELNTNGYFITQDVLDEMKEIGCFPLIKISFDGIGYHDWMRDYNGSEERTLSSMKLCVQNGFRVAAQTQVHRKNAHSMMETAKTLNDIGVSVMRIIRTTEVPRWVENAPDATLSVEEYYTEMLEFAKEYFCSAMNMTIIIWQFMDLYPNISSYKIATVKYCDGEYKDKFPGCKGNRGLIAVTSTGEVVPCMQMSGYLAENNISLGNVHDKSLHEILTSSDYLDNILLSLGDIRKQNNKCQSCKYYEYCAGGCRALGLLYSGEALDFAGADVTKCYFFENGWYERINSSLDKWKNLSVMKL